jgi:hypothetical protein
VLVGFDLRITGGTAVVAQAVPFIPPIRPAGTGVVFPKPRHQCRPHSEAGARAWGIPQEGFGLVVECCEIVVGEIALLFGEAAEMETTHRRVIGIILVPEQPVSGELVEIV